MTQRLARVASRTVLTAALVGSIWGVQQMENIELVRPDKAPSTQSTTELAKAHARIYAPTGRKKVDRCIVTLIMWAKGDPDDAQTADVATVTCSAITKDRDAQALDRWIYGKGKFSSHKWALEIVG